MKKAPQRATTRPPRKAEPSTNGAAPVPNWTFLTNHAHVLLCLFQKPDQRLRDVAVAVGITERMVQRLVSELVEAGYLQIIKEGRCNRYTIDTRLQLRHPLELQHTIGDLIAAVGKQKSRRR